jgi:hypothetical protein
MDNPCTKSYHERSNSDKLVHTRCHADSLSLELNIGFVATCKLKVHFKEIALCKMAGIVGV